MLLCDRPPFLFVHVQRTGGTTLTNLLIGALSRDIHHLPQHANARTEEMSLLESATDHFTFAFTRNPWDRMLSWYSLLHQMAPLSVEADRDRFEAYLSEDAAVEGTDGSFHYNTLDYVTTTAGTLCADQIYRYEHLPEAFADIFRRLGVALPEIPVLNTTRPKRYQEFYTPHSRLLIEQKCAVDIDRFGYTFD